MTTKQLLAAYAVIAVITVGIVLTVYTVIGYIVMHFILKFW